MKGPDAEALVDYVITRDATEIGVMKGKYVILCNEKGTILHDPVLLRPAAEGFWFSISDSTLMQWFQGVNVGMDFDVDDVDRIEQLRFDVLGHHDAEILGHT